MNNIFKIDTAPVKHYTFVSPYNKTLLDQDILRLSGFENDFLFGFNLFSLNQVFIIESHHQNQLHLQARSDGRKLQCQHPKPIRAPVNLQNSTCHEKKT
jgi:hypothetical protein